MALLPSEDQWLRVEQLAGRLESLSPEAAAEYLNTLKAEGESATTLSIVGSWLSLPALVAPISEGRLVANRYTLLKKLGEGGMGTVWCATQQLIGREVALKMLHPALVSPALHERFLQEMGILGRLEHQGIVKIFDAGVHTPEDGQGIPFYAMELVDGAPLDRWAEGHRNDRRKVLEIMSDICAAIQHAHDRGIVHRDLKPANIMVDRNDRVVVLDFGIARLATGEPDDPTGVFVGTPHYAAPEQHLGRDRDFRSGESVDVYATGAIIFEVLAGRRLFEFPRGTSIAEMRRAIVEDAPPRLSEVIEGCPRGLDEIVARAVRRSPADRYYSIAGLGRALRRVAASLYGTDPAPAPWIPAKGSIVPGTKWKLTRRIGEGGAGEVWEGVHEQLGERRVFKFCDTEEKARTLKREMTLFRLLKERVGRNPHFIQYHEVSLDEAPWYLMMEDVEALDLESWAAGQPGGLSAVDLHKRIEIIAQTAEALQSAHEAGIIHRDIKPANLLIRTASRDVAIGVNGAGAGAGLHVLIADFGIGQIVTDELVGGGTRLGFTATVSYLRDSGLSGTMLYLAPEVAEGHAATARSDIYSLGIVLWQLLVGDVHVALDAARWASRIEDPLLQEDLNRCLAGRPEERWASAGDLAASLRALPERRSAEHRRLEELARRGREEYRRGVLRTATVAAVILLIVSGLAGYAWYLRRQASIDRARASLGEIEGLVAMRSASARDRLVKELPNFGISDPAVRRGLRTAAISILSQCSFLPLTPSPIELKDGDWIAERGERMITANLSDGLPGIVDLTVSPNWRHVLSEGEQGMTNVRINERGTVAAAIAEDGSLKIWSGRNFFAGIGGTLPSINGQVHDGCFALSPTTLSKTKKTIVAIARPGGAIHVGLIVHNAKPNDATDDGSAAKALDIPLYPLFRKSTPEQDEFPESSSVTMLAFSTVPEGVLAAAGPDSNLMSFWIVGDSNNKAEGTFTGSSWHPDNIRCLKWNPLGMEVATGAQDGVLRIWRYVPLGNVPQSEPFRQVDLGGPIRDLCWTADGELIAVLLDSGSIRVLNSKALNQPAVAILAGSAVRKVAFLGSNILLGWGAGKTLAWGDAEPYYALRRVSMGPVSAAFQPSGSLVASASDVLAFLTPNSLGWTGGMRTEMGLPSASLKDEILFFERGEWKQASVLKTSSPDRARFSHSANRTADGWYVSSPQSTRVLYSQGRELKLFEDTDLKKAISSSASDPPTLAAAGDAGSLIAWVDSRGLSIQNFGNGGTWVLSGQKVNGLCFSPDSRLLACRREGGVDFIDTNNGSIITSCSVSAPAMSPTPVAFSPDGRWLAVSGLDHELLLGSVPLNWSKSPGSLSGTFDDPLVIRPATRRQLVSIDWSQGGSRVACGTADGFVQVWNLSLLLRTLRMWRLDDINTPDHTEPPYLPLTLY